jgi:hypothetical protein
MKEKFCPTCEASFTWVHPECPRCVGRVAIRATALERDTAIRERDEARAEVERLRQRAEDAEAQVKAWQEDWREGRRELLAWAKEEP